MSRTRTTQKGGQQIYDPLENYAVSNLEHKKQGRDCKSIIGLSGGAELIFRGQLARGIGTIVFFRAFPIIWAIAQATDISWAVVGAFVLIALGAITLVKAFCLKDDV